MILLIICSALIVLSSILIEHNYGKAAFHIIYAIAILIAMTLVLKYAVNLQIRRINEVYTYQVNLLKRKEFLCVF